MKFAQGQHRTYSPVGRCIYCGTTEGKLTTEHIIAFALGGNVTLPKASCKSCADQTKRFEQICARYMFGPYRIKVGIQTRHPEDRPSELPLEIESRKGSREKIQVPGTEHPSGILLVKFRPPGILSGEAPPKPGEMTDYKGWLHIPDPATIRTNFARPDLNEFIAANFDELAFARMLAKIACSFAVAEKRQFTEPHHDLPRFILGKTEVFHHLVGGSLGDMPQVPGVLHRLGFAHEYRGDTVYLVVTIQLFAFLGAPQYKVVMAELRKSDGDKLPLVN